MLYLLRRVNEQSHPREDYRLRIGLDRVVFFVSEASPTVRRKLRGCDMADFSISMSWFGRDTKMLRWRELKPYLCIPCCSRIHECPQATLRLTAFVAIADNLSFLAAAALSASPPSSLSTHAAAG